MRPTSLRTDRTKLHGSAHSRHTAPEDVERPIIANLQKHLDHKAKHGPVKHWTRNAEGELVLVSE